MDLETAVEHIARQKEIQYRENIFIRKTKIRFDIEFVSRKLADEFSFAWATSIRDLYDGDFILFLHYLDDGRLIPIPKMYKPGPAPTVQLKLVKGCQRPEKRLPFF